MKMLSEGRVTLELKPLVSLSASVQAYGRQSSLAHNSAMVANHSLGDAEGYSYPSP